MSLELSYSLLPGATAHSTTVLVSAVVDGQTLHCDKVDVARSSARERFIKEALKRPEVKGVTTPTLRDALLAICAEVTAAATPSNGPRKTLDMSRLARPECFHRPEVSGIAFPIARLEMDKPVGKWAIALRGRRQTRAPRPGPEPRPCRRTAIVVLSDASRPGTGSAPRLVGSV